MVDAVSRLLPEPVPINHLGLYREKLTLQPVEYYNNLPYHKISSDGSEGGIPVDLAIVVDPIIATGATAMAAVETLQDWGVKKVLVLSVLCSAKGVKRVASIGESVDIWVGGMDPETDSKGMIKPGIGDVGDRLFLTLGK
jgi:uracil phosphoribosyltransferase